jgi:hypothetical protein
MTAAAITEATFNDVTNYEVYVNGTVVTTADWIVLDSAYPGTLDFRATLFPTDNNNEVVTWYFGKVVATADGTDATDTSFVYDGGTALQRSSGGFYIYNDTSKEILYVVSDSGYTTTTGTLTVKRGCLGTTAVKILDNDEFRVLNCIIITFSTAVGDFFGRFTPLPTDPYVDLF